VVDFPLRIFRGADSRLCRRVLGPLNLASPGGADPKPVTGLDGETMTSDRDIYATAALTMRQHGGSAVLFAAQRADELLAAGDADGAAVWRRIKSAIMSLEGADRWDFGFTCGVFSVVLAAGDVVIPGSKGEALRRSSLGQSSDADTTGPCVLRATGEDGTICDLPVHALWLTHPTKPWPFFGFRVADAAAVVASLKQYEGRMVRLAFRRLSS